MRIKGTPRKGFELLLVMTFVITAVGCGGRLGDFTFLTTKQFNLPVTTMEKHGRVTGEDCARNILGIPIGHVQPHTKEAIDQAVEKAQGSNALIDAVIEWNAFTLILYGENCIKAEGEAVTLK